MVFEGLLVLAVLREFEQAKRSPVKQRARHPIEESEEAVASSGNNHDIAPLKGS